MAEKITYEDKDKHSDDPAKSKWRDKDANEIKEIVNGLVDLINDPESGILKRLENLEKEE